MTGVHWVSEDEELLLARRDLGLHGTVHAQVESLGELGWDWHVWRSATPDQRYGLADTLEQAVQKAEHALEAMTRGLGAALAA